MQLSPIHASFAKLITDLAIVIAIYIVIISICCLQNKLLFQWIISKLQCSQMVVYIVDRH